MTPEEKKAFDKAIEELRDLRADYYRNNFQSSQDFQKYSRFNTRLKIPAVASLPTTCEQSEVCVLTSNGKLYVCSTTDTWTAQT